MNDKIVRLGPLTQAMKRLQTIANTFDSPDFDSALRCMSPTEAAALRRAILRVAAFLDDSISNSTLGSIFERTGNHPVNAMLANIASAYGVPQTVAGTTGTTGLNVPAVATLAGEGQKIAVGRDCHVSVIGGLYLSGAKPVYLSPRFDHEIGVLIPPTLADINALLDTHPDVRGIVLTMPTYHGLMGNIQPIIDECHRRGVLVMVDGAHGPHFHFLRGLGFPMPAEDAGADMVTQSTHKVMSALNQGSLLHFNDVALIPRYEEFQSMGFQSTSFSYPILLSIEHAVEQMVTNGQRIWARAVQRARHLRDGAARLPGVVVLDEQIVDGQCVIGLDPTRVTVNVRGTGVSGYEVTQSLLDSGLIVEMATPDVVLFLVGPGTKEEVVDATLDTLGDVVRRKLRARFPGVAFVPPPLPESIISPREAIFTARERVPRAEAIGRVSAETIGCFPPGQAIFVAGERITESGVNYLSRARDAGAHLKRVQDDHFQTIDVVRDIC